jgi:hypothetical protein
MTRAVSFPLKRRAIRPVVPAVSPPDKVKLLRFALAVAASGTVAVAYYPLLWAPARVRVLALVVAAAVMAPVPLMVPPEARVLRTLVAIASLTLWVKLYDVHFGAARGRRPTFASYLAFLPNTLSLVHRRLDDERQPTARGNWRRLAVAGTVSALTTVLFLATFTVRWERYGFAAEHVVKVVGFFLMIVPLSAIQAAAWRLGGGRGRDFMDNPFAARTPADFWRRYNRPVHQFLEEDLFVPAGGRRHRVRATIAVFLFSAAIHEYVFAMGVGRVQGYQAAFFLAQGLAVAATLRVKPRGLWVVPWVAGTFAFNVATGVLFFGSVNGLLPFYRNWVPLWE